jgi:alpha-ketoglutarate-dependent taurine dioxygenase
MSVFEIQPFVGQQSQHGAAFPLLLTPAQAGASVADLVRQPLVLTDLLSRHGALVFRDWPVGGDSEFDQFVTAFGFDNFAYRESLSNAVRRNRTSRVFTANEAPAEIEIFLHHEMAQTPRFPSHLFFFCEKTPEDGGATPLCRSDVLLKKLQKRLPEFVNRCRQRGGRYTLTMPGSADQTSGQGRSWRETLNVSATDQAEHRLASLGYQWQWLPEDCLRVTTPTLPLVRKTPNGEEVFFNQLIAAFCGWQDQRNNRTRSVTYGDGTDFDESDLQAAVETAYDSVYDHEWQAGDIALIDNYRVMHGRRPFAGQRSVLASLCEMVGEH